MYVATLGDDVGERILALCRAWDGRDACMPVSARLRLWLGLLDNEATPGPCIECTAHIELARTKEGAEIEQWLERIVDFGHDHAAIGLRQPIGALSIDPLERPARGRARLNGPNHNRSGQN